MVQRPATSPTRRIPERPETVFQTDSKATTAKSDPGNGRIRGDIRWTIAAPKSDKKYLNAAASIASPAVSRGSKQTMDSKEKLILALETAVGKGSIAVLRGKDVLISERGAGTRASELLDTVGSLLRHLGMNSADVDTIAVSVGPGSYTGIRIGIATAIGLARGLEASFVGVPLLPALANAIAPKTAAALVPIGRSRIAVQRFTSRGDFTNATPPYAVEASALCDEIRANPNIDFIASADLLSVGAFAEADMPNLHFVKSNLADLVGQYTSGSATNVEPIYL